MAVSGHADTPATGHISHSRISYPIHHSRGRELSVWFWWRVPVLALRGAGGDDRFMASRREYSEVPRVPEAEEVPSDNPVAFQTPQFEGVVTRPSVA